MARRRTSRAGQIMLAGTLAHALLVLTSGTAHATVPRLPGVPTVRLVDELNPGATYQTVSGLVDSTWQIINPPGVPTKGDVMALLAEDTVGEWRNRVYGTVTYADGKAAEGVQIVLTLVDGARADVDAANAEVARTVTDESGRWIAMLPTTEDVLAAAEFGNGTVNVWVSAIQYKGAAAWSGGGMVYTSLFTYGPGGAAFAPLNVGPMTISPPTEQAASLYEAPSNDPALVDRSLVFGNGAGETVATAPVGYPLVVEVPEAAITPSLPPPPAWPTWPNDPSDDQDPGGDGTDRDDKCRYPKHQGRWHTDDKRFERRFQPVGEVHGWLGTKVSYKYSEKANSSIKAMVNREGKGWKFGGRSNVTNDSGATTSLGAIDDYVAVPVEAEFTHVYESLTWCPDGYDYERGPVASHEDRVYSTGWTGGLRYGTTELGGDGWDAYRDASSEGRAMTMYQNTAFTKDKGKTYKYELGVSAFGIGLDIESDHNITHAMTIKTTTRLKDWHLFGNKDVPPSTANNAIYVSG